MYGFYQNSNNRFFFSNNNCRGVKVVIFWGGGGLQARRLNIVDFALLVNTFQS